MRSLSGAAGTAVSLDVLRHPSRFHGWPRLGLDFEQAQEVLPYAICHGVSNAHTGHSRSAKGRSVWACHARERRFSTAKQFRRAKADAQHTCDRGAHCSANEAAIAAIAVRTDQFSITF